MITLYISSISCHHCLTELHHQNCFSIISNFAIVVSLRLVAEVFNPLSSQTDFNAQALLPYKHLIQWFFNGTSHCKTRQKHVTHNKVKTRSLMAGHHYILVCVSFCIVATPLNVEPLQRYETMEDC